MTQQVVSPAVQATLQTRSNFDELYRNEKFGAWLPIVQNLNYLYQHLLINLIPEVPSAQPLQRHLERLDPSKRHLVFGNPVFRIILHKAFDQKAEIESDPARSKSDSTPDEAEMVCRQVLEFLQANIEVDETLFQIFGTGTGSSPTRKNYLGTPPFQVVLWEPQSIEMKFSFPTQFESLFQQIIAPTLTHEAVRLRSPLAREYQNMKQALKILNQLSPKMLVETLAHVRIIALADSKDTTIPIPAAQPNFVSWASGSNYAIPGSIFLSPLVAAHPLRAVEAIFHESTHQKAANLITTLPLLKRNYNQANIQPVNPFWHSPETAWPVDRSLFAMHFYVHSVSFYKRVAENWAELVQVYGVPEGHFDPELLAQQGQERARFLYGQIMERKANFLEPDGLAFVDWLYNQVPNPVLKGPI